MTQMKDVSDFNKLRVQLFIEAALPSRTLSEQHPLRVNRRKEVEVEAMFSPFMPALRRRARRIRLRRPAGCRIEPMPRMRWYS